MDITRTRLTTIDRLAVFDVGAVKIAGPANYVGPIDPHNLPDGFRTVSDDEWELIEKADSRAHRGVKIDAGSMARILQSLINPETVRQIAESLTAAQRFPKLNSAEVHFAGQLIDILDNQVSPLETVV